MNRNDGPESSHVHNRATISDKIVDLLVKSHHARHGQNVYPEVYLLTCTWIYNSKKLHGQTLDLGYQPNTLAARCGYLNLSRTTVVVLSLPVLRHLLGIKPIKTLEQAYTPFRRFTASKSLLCTRQQTLGF